MKRVFKRCNFFSSCLLLSPRISLAGGALCSFLPRSFCSGFKLFLALARPIVPDRPGFRSRTPIPSRNLLSPITFLACEVARIAGRSTMRARSRGESGIEDSTFKFRTRDANRTSLPRACVQHKILSRSLLPPFPPPPFLMLIFDSVTHVVLGLDTNSFPCLSSKFRRKLRLSLCYISCT